MPDDYYVSKYSGEEIDALLGKAGSSVQVACNPNLLDNWYFGRLVNQRGQASFTGSFVYTIDRWEIGNALKSLTVAPGGVFLEGTGDMNNNYLFQRVERLPVGKYSFSILFEGNTSEVALTNKLVDTGAILAVNSRDASGLLSLTWDQPEEFDQNSAYFRIHAPGNVKILAAKLELGDHQTLAHKDASGNWVLNEVPDYGEQLRRCQRYFYQISYVQYQTINVAYEDTAYAFLMLPLPVEMRIKNPVVTQSAPIALGASEKTLLGAEVSGCMARLAVNYDAIANPVWSCYAYCPHAGGVTFTLNANL